MSTVVSTKIVKIGNSQGIRIPKLLLDQLNLGESVELEVLGNQLVVRPAACVRHEWDAHFRQMAEHGDDQLVDQPMASLTTWDNEWEW
ncbi:MAG: AbrB/MazE/SpoVT family DNA-binding domain-containing protein [Oculatellaceae cyanobacterium Prado106]|nr:AbrB/MazE/SpoVT family DNA-binding domain-containing protein [Oculatellaceae cyanobacterium Prado106]